MYIADSSLTFLLTDTLGASTVPSILLAKFFSEAKREGAMQQRVHSQRALRALLKRRRCAEGLFAREPLVLLARLWASVNSVNLLIDSALELREYERD